MRKIYSVLTVFLLSLIPVGIAYAQEDIKQEISVQGGLGLSGLKYSLDNGDTKQKFGGNIGIGYHYFFNQKFGLVTGLELSFLSSEGSFDSMSDTYKTTDSEGESFNFSSTVRNYEERQRATYLNIPIMGQYQMPVTGMHQFYGMLGVKIGIPLSAKYKTSGASLAASGFYPQYGANDPINIDQVISSGFGNFTSNPVDETLKLNVSFMLAAEAGMKWYLNETMSLYTGAYIDYGLNDVSKKHDKEFMIYDAVNPTRYTNNSLLEAQYTPGAATLEVVDKVVPISFGLKVRLAFKTSR
jgi:hypothetical protein